LSYSFRILGKRVAESSRGGKVHAGHFKVHWRRHEGTGNPCKYGLAGPTLNHSNNANHKNKTKKPQQIQAETQSTQT
jgi:hypothetical protein